MCVYIVCVHARAYARACVHVCVCACMCALHACVHACSCVCAHACMRVFGGGMKEGGGRKIMKIQNLKKNYQMGEENIQLIMGGGGGGGGGERHLEVTQADEGKMPHKRQQDRL